jgi:tRNA dimethylallyltransferase
VSAAVAKVRVKMALVNSTGTAAPLPAPYAPTADRSAADSPVVVIVGPTGSGKSALALEVAGTFSGEIINCDSLQLYRGFDIGTAKTPPADRRGILHHLFDVLDPSERYSAGDYARAARTVLRDVSARKKLPVIVGGTGFYLRALFYGLPPLPAREEGVRARLSARELRRPGSLHRLLMRLEPEAAARIHVNDTQKLIRALEVRMLTRTAMPPPAAAEPLTGYGALILGLSPDRARLAEAIHLRTLEMFQAGLLDEVRGLLERGCAGSQKSFDGTQKPFESLGYKQALAHLSGRIGLEEAIESTEIETRQYAKRQWTWFRRDPRVEWLEGFGGDAEVEERALTRVRDFLGSVTPRNLALREPEASG